MHLKRLKLVGFKSFVEPTNIPFTDTMTAIVGPNGCGKSNIIDAVRWVLGESSAKNLRGDAMTDVIFNGSSARKAVGQCSVELVFDNSSGRITGPYANYNELSVKRLVTREAQSFYYLNGTKCRRRDVTDLFLGTGLGPRSYAIIEQGMISQLIESKPHELRVFIEEAAGVSKYKERRKDTMSRITQTHANLARLSDLRSELALQIDSLQRQAAVAQRYTQLKSRQRVLQDEIATIKWLDQANVIANSDHTIDTLSTELADYQQQQQNNSAKLIDVQTEQALLSTAIQEQQTQKHQLNSQIARLEHDRQFAETRAEQLQQAILQQQDEIQMLAARLENGQTKIDTACHDVANLQPTYAELHRQLTQSQAQLSASEQALEQINSQYSEHHQNLHNAKNSMINGTSQQDALHQIIQKTQQRHDQLNQSLHEISQKLVEQTKLCESLQQTTHAHQQHGVTATKKLEDALYHHQVAEQHSLDAASELTQLTQDISQCDMMQSTLNTLQVSTDENNVIDTAAIAMCNWLDIDPQHNHLFDTVLSYLQHPQISFCDPLTLYEQIQDVDTGVTSICLGHTFTRDKKAGTLAALCLNIDVPDMFNRIHLADHTLSMQDAQRAVNQLPAGESLMLANGTWLQHDALYQVHADPDVHASTSSTLAREQRIAALTDELTQLQQKQQTCQDTLSQFQATQALAQEQLAAAQLTKDTAHQVLQDSDQTLQQGLFALKQLQLQHTQYTDELRDCATVLDQEQSQLAALTVKQTQLVNAVSALTKIDTDNVQQQADYRSAITQHQAEVQRLQSERHQTELLIQQAQSTHTYLLNAQTELHAQLTRQQQHCADLVSQFDELKQPEKANGELLQRYLNDVSSLDRSMSDKQQALLQFEHQCQQLTISNQSLSTRISKTKDKIQAEQLLLEGAKIRASSIVDQLTQTQKKVEDILPTLQADADPVVWQTELETIASNIEQLGPVNLAAVSEFAVQTERKTRLDQQDNDLCSALATLESAMRKMDNETKSRFKATFDQVNADLQLLFPKVFDGGSAYLALTDDDMLESGVTIMARPPGKKNSTIHLLSGGEKALTALALVFAIFRLNPAPFCLLDEVDAPLDDANVGRFCKLVSEMSQTVQFIYISHNKIAMEMASHLTGVTMAEPGVSRMVAVDIDEAVAITQA